MLWEVHQAIPGQACSRQAGAHVVEDGADEGPCALQSADHLGVAADGRDLASERAHGKDGTGTCRA
eukprot:8016749-Pyramimonas_sp.AAC.1